MLRLHLNHSFQIYSIDDENTLVVWTFASNFRSHKEELTLCHKPRLFINQTVDVAQKNRGY